MDRVLWYGVVAVSYPWVAAQYAAYGEVESFEWSVLLYGFHCILGACGSEAAGRWCKGGYAVAVEVDWQQQQ